MATDARPMDLVFFGSGAFGVPTLERLVASHRVRGIVTQPDKPAGRGGALTPTPVGAWAAARAPAIPLLKPAKVNEASVRDEIRAWAAEAWVVIAFGQKLGAALLADRFAINLHASLLPRWRGAAPIHAAIVAGDAEIGSSVITLADRMDAGLVLASSARPRDVSRTAGEYHDLLAAEGPELVERVLRDRRAGTLRPAAQDESMVTLAPKLSREDGWVDFGHSPDRCRDRVHGLTPWPGVSVLVRGQPLKLLRVEALGAGGNAGGVGASTPGTLVDAAQGIVACGGGALRLVEVQSPGKRAMAWADYIRGARLAAGEALIGQGPAR